MKLLAMHTCFFNGSAKGIEPVFVFRKRKTNGLSAMKLGVLPLEAYPASVAALAPSSSTLIFTT